MSEWNSYGIATLVIQAIAAGATVWAVWVALTPQRKMGIIELKSLKCKYTNGKAMLELHIDNYRNTDLIATGFHILKYNENKDELMNVIISGCTGGKVVIKHGFNHTFLSRDIFSEPKKNLKADGLSITFLDNSSWNFALKKHHRKQIEKFINQK